MKKNRLFGLFMTGKRSAHNLVETPLATAQPESLANRLYLEKHSSSFIINLMQDDLKSQQYYKEYLVSYHRTLGYLKQKDYKNARITADDAYSNLARVDVLPAALGKDFYRITEISSLINENLPKNKY
ncbi:MAG: hypothetical protein K2X50_06600 [Gammaproteobacteria bacterium]|nr:hypothetical protein [Gammaproteobacteria bacterium]